MSFFGNYDGLSSFDGAYGALPYAGGYAGLSRRSSCPYAELARAGVIRLSGRSCPYAHLARNRGYSGLAGGYAGLAGDFAGFGGDYTGFAGAAALPYAGGFAGAFNGIY